MKNWILLQKEFLPIAWRRRWEAEFSNRRLKINCFCNNTILLQVLGDILSKKENRPKIIVLSLNIMIFIFSGKKFNSNSLWRILNWMYLLKKCYDKPLCDFSHCLLNVAKSQRVFSISTNLQKRNEIRVHQFKVPNKVFDIRNEDTI